MLIWKAFQNTEEWRFSFLKYLFSFYRYWHFSSMQIRAEITSYCLQLKSGKYWINDISGNIEAVSLRSDCLSSIFTVYCFTILLFTGYKSYHSHRSGANQTSTHYIFQAKQNYYCHYSKPVKGNDIWRFQSIHATFENLFFCMITLIAKLTWRAIEKFSLNQHIRENKRLIKM